MTISQTQKLWHRETSFITNRVNSTIYKKGIYHSDGRSLFIYITLDCATILDMQQNFGHKVKLR